MEIEIPSFPVVFFSFIFVFMAMKILRKTSQTSCSASKLPPGPWKLPLVGNIHQLIGPLIHRTLRDLAMKHGPLMYLRVGEVPTIIISSPEYAKEVMRVHDLAFASRPSVLFSQVMLYDGTDLAFAPYGEYWKQVRKIFMQELLNVARVQSFRAIREEEMFNFIDLISSNVGDVINLSEMVNMLTYNIISRAACGRTRMHNKEFLPVMVEAMKVSLGFEISDLFPSVKLFSQMSRSRPKLQKLRERAERIFDEIIAEHKEQKPVGKSGDGITDEDLVDVLLKFHNNDDLGFSLTSDNLYALIFEIFTGGTETSATSVEWAMSELMKNPTAMKKAQDEVREVFNRKGLADETGLDEMKYLKSAIKESMRLHPILPLLLPRESRETCEINGYVIPAKTQTIVNAWVIGRDPRYWSEPESFKPERFLDSSIGFKSNNCEFIPFGGGRRICVGMSFAVVSVELSLAFLLYHFDWILPNGVKHEDLDMTESFGTTLKRKNALQLIPIAYELSPIGKSHGN
ncbi:cytochrome P450 71D9-like [Humulus lupulus]|uniref:cytochrome P450 71D9-like n=1 Tax=Humulus lupulus TaxID=3486 RepID=UPI002B40EBA0|nr:cytochrome P450 71D9-like [Humulus lupulus]